MREIRTLTGLRGYAALAVCIFHYTLQRPVDSVWMELARAGRLGVCVFFVLSGFILTHVYLDWFRERVTAGAYSEFLWRRLARIYPLHLFMLLVVVMMIWQGTMAAGTNDTPLNFLYNALLIHGWGFTNATSFNLASWTISVEAFCYLFLPFIIAALARAHWSVLVIAITACAFATGYDLVIHAIPALGINVDLSTLQFNYGRTLIRYFCAFAGAIALYAWVRRWYAHVPGWICDALVLTGSAYMLCDVLIFKTGHWQFTSFWLGSAILIVGLYRDAGWGRLLFGNPIATWLGKISYALYLVHATPLLWLMGAAYPYTAWFDLPLAVMLVIALALSTLIHYAVERPARRVLRQLANHSPPTVRASHPERIGTPLRSS